MQIETPQRKSSRELMLPMINVVFLLLIFLMLMGRITENNSQEITPALSQSEQENEREAKFFVTAEGQLIYGELSDKAAIIAALRNDIAERETEEPTSALMIRADKDADFSYLLTLAKEIAQQTNRDIKLEVQTR